MIYVVLGVPWTMLTSHFKGSFLCLVLGGFVSLCGENCQLKWLNFDI